MGNFSSRGGKHSADWRFAIPRIVIVCIISLSLMFAAIPAATGFGTFDRDDTIAYGAAKTVTVKFNANGGSVSPSSIKVVVGEAAGKLPVPTRKGYSFAGWYDAASGGNPFGSDTIVTAAVTRYAHWTANQYTCTFDANGGTVAIPQKVVTFGAKYDTLPTPQRSGYIFSGWYTQITSGSLISVSSNVTTADNITLYARWKAESYTVSFDAAGGTVSTASKKVAYGSKYGSLPTPKRTGYTFDGWYTQKTGGTLVNANSLLTDANNVTLYAHWTPVSYTITFNANSGTVATANKKVVFGEKYGVLPTPLRAGYAFDGWYTARTGGTLISADSTLTTAGNVTLYARWTVGRYTITFDANGGTVSTASKTMALGEKYGTLPTPQRAGYTFAGWYTLSTGGSLISASSTLTTAGNVTLYARWTPASYTIAFNANGGTVSTASKTVTLGEKYGTLPTPQRAGYTFTGWYTLGTGGSLISADSILTTAGNVTLYAHWNKNESTEKGYYVSPAGDNNADGSYERPWKTVNFAVGKLKAGDTLFLRKGSYHEKVVMNKISGTEVAPIRVVAYPNETAVIDADGSGDVLFMRDCEYITIEGLELTNGQYGISYESTTTRGTAPLHDVTFLNNKVYNINGTHGICVYARNYNAPVTNLVMDGNEVYFTRTDSSEATVFNGNIDGFTIRNNVIHNGNNIAIDMIGFEGTARKGSSGTYKYTADNVDYARNGKVYGNTVYGSCTNDNNAYWSSDSKIAFGGQYDRSCSGIYVDGGSYIEIYNNFIFDNDVGIDVATEHKASDGFSVTGMYVHDNIIASNGGWCGLVFGGYMSSLGYTYDSRFENNILYGNASGIAVQKSSGCTVKNNVVVGGEAAIELTSAYRTTNTFGVNHWQDTDKKGWFFDDLDTLPVDQRNIQVKSAGPLLRNPGEGDFTPIGTAVNGAGTTWKPAEPSRVLYAKFTSARQEARNAAAFLQSKTFDFETALVDGNLRTWLNKQLQAAGYKNSEVRFVLRTGAGSNAAMADSTGITTLTLNATNGKLDATRIAAIKQGLGAGKTKDIAYMVQVITWYGDNSYTQELTTKQGVVMQVRK